METVADKHKWRAFSGINIDDLERP